MIRLSPKRVLRIVIRRSHVGYGNVIACGDQGHVSGTRQAAVTAAAVRPGGDRARRGPVAEASSPEFSSHITVPFHVCDNSAAF